MTWPPSMEPFADTWDAPQPFDRETHVLPPLHLWPNNDGRTASCCARCPSGGITSPQCCAHDQWRVKQVGHAIPRAYVINRWWPRGVFAWIRRTFRSFVVSHGDEAQAPHDPRRLRDFFNHKETP